MRLIAQIFRKDVRHFYPEILIIIVLMATFAWAAPFQWSGSTNRDSHVFLAWFLRLLLPLACLVLLSRLIHDEPLVGDRQFWVTRPIGWKTLLAAKSLFVVCFLGMPLLFMRVYLLEHANVPLASSIGPLLLSTILLLLALVLPFAAMATVTKNFSRQTIALLASVVYLIIVAFSESSISVWVFGNAITPPYLLEFLVTLTAFVLGAVILLQYARRRTRLNWLVLAVLPPTLAVLALFSPDRSLVQSLYQVKTTSAGLPLTFDKNPERQQPNFGEPAVVEGRVMLQLPLTRLAAVPFTRLRVRGVSINVTDAKGFHWTSPYQQANLSEDQMQPTLMIEIPAKIFARLRQTPVHLDLNVVEERYGSSSSQTVQMDERGTFTAPQHGMCFSSDEGTIATCLYGVRYPSPIKVLTTIRDQPCAIVKGGTTAGYSNFVGSDDRLLSLDFDPVVASHFTVTVPNTSSTRLRSAYLCPGAFIRFTPTYIASRDRINVSADGIVMGLYAWSTKSQLRKTFPPETSE